ncbi:MAG TPA: hypothetical protein DER09_01205 [Prolixibacteraceae bacterium]|nr:hypothetical protein [Prolixibacteraceae bacterium]
MNRLIKYCIFLFALLQGCEEIYTPEIEKVESVIVADARVVAGGSNNVISLYQSMSYNEGSIIYPPVTGATVSIISSNGVENKLFESSPGKFAVGGNLDANLQYKLKIVSGKNTYESSFEPVPPVPLLDTIFGEPGIKILAPDGNNDVDDIIEVEGVQLLGNILHEKQLPYYRFTTRRIIQFTYTVEVPTMGGSMPATMYAWDSSTSGESFNIAGPAGYSSSVAIVRHPLWFLSKKPGLNFNETFEGWILILYHYGLSKSAYDFYNDLNSQLNASGKMFDPLYVQAKSNIRCTNNPQQVILGNFEIATQKETRYFVRFISNKSGYLIKPIPYFYHIPVHGQQLDVPPDFWETPSKQYPEQ